MLGDIRTGAALHPDVKPPFQEPRECVRLELCKGREQPRLVRMQILLLELSTDNVQNLFGIASEPDPEVRERLLIGEQVIDLVTIPTNQMPEKHFSRRLSDGRLAVLPP